MKAPECFDDRFVGMARRHQDIEGFQQLDDVVLSTYEIKSQFDARALGPPTADRDASAPNKRASQRLEIVEIKVCRITHDEQDERCPKIGKWCRDVFEVLRAEIPISTPAASIT